MTCVVVLIALVSVVAWSWTVDPVSVGKVLIAAGWSLFVAAALFRLAAMATSGRPYVTPGEPQDWPRYTIVAALYREADVVGQLCERLGRFDYPPDRLQGLLALEEDDIETLGAALACVKPPWLEIVIVPNGHPRTKPRALNHALGLATGDLLAVYDAEDEPDPVQLKAAARRFWAEPDRLACLQAPLRVRKRENSRTPFLDQQFAAEYAALFEVILPAMGKWGLPFPLGGTSNHFRVDALKSSGGWDPWNVTEDADLGFRLWRMGWRLDTITPPTWESPPGAFRDWLPQRTRWMKGYMQTLIVHLRSPWRLGWRGLAALSLTIGLGLLSAAVFAPMSAWLLLNAGSIHPLGMTVLIGASGAALATAWLGMRRAGSEYGMMDAAGSLLYWPLLSLAFVHALWRLIRQPHHWDKTQHLPDAASGPEPLPSPKAGDDVPTVQTPDAHDKELA